MDTEEGSADLSHVLAVAETIGRTLGSYTVVVNKSTVPVGTADRVRVTIAAALAARGVDVPVLPGIMPITNSTQLLRFSDSCGAEVPRWIRTRLQAFGDDAAAIKDFGADVVAALCQRLQAGGAPGFHFYTLNQANGTLEVCRRLGWAGAAA